MEAAAIRRDHAGGHGAISPRRYTPALANPIAWAKQPHHVYLHGAGGHIAAVAFGGVPGAVALLEQMAGPEFVAPRCA
ncbi:hypothetical protein M4D49_27520 [Cupriavidus pauculus]|uniref:hypothetical protein n=1 Tax=Burkholderiaceae TaxID=119060 RepID=UPI00049329EE|nr:MULTISPECIES: hypothetical protein [Burkholderiaceae]MCM3609240.1 hypothetical protein [Cupriavidus pauculus]